MQVRTIRPPASFLPLGWWSQMSVRWTLRTMIPTSLTLLIACAAPGLAPAVLDVRIDGGDRTIAVGETLALSAAVETLGDASDAVAWASADPGIADVDDGGIVTGVSGGDTLVTATSVFDAGVSDTIRVEVTAAAAVVGVTIDQPDPVLLEGDTLDFSATVDATGGASEEVTWATDDPSVATIDAVTGTATAVGPGVAGITATSAFDGSRADSTTLTVPEPLVLEVDTTLEEGTSVSFDLHGGVMATIDWGDGARTRVEAPGPVAHPYAAEGAYTIRISGTVPHFGGGAPGTLTAVTSWGEVGLTSLAGAFDGAQQLIAVPTDLPSTVTDLTRTFANTARLRQDLGTWDVSNVTIMRQTFASSEAFEGDLSSWDVSSVTDMRGMFTSSYTAARGLSTWDVSNVTDMSFMLADIPFDDDITGWDVANVVDMSGMFSYTWSFDQDIGGWDVSNVTDMSSMFEFSEDFDGAIGGWDVSNVTDMTFMFDGALAFDQDLSGWCVAAIPEEPVGFASTAQTEPLPEWGTCPGD
jgi:surface protein